VVLDRAFGQPEFAADLLVRHAAQQAAQHVRLPGRKPRIDHLVHGGGDGKAVVRRLRRRCLCDGRRQGDVPAERMLEEFRQQVRRRGLADISGCAALQRVYDRAARLVGGEHHHRQGRSPELEFREQIEAAHAGHVQVQQDQVDVAVLLEQGQRLGAVAGLQDCDIAEQFPGDVPYRRADRRMVIAYQKLGAGHSGS